MGDQLGDDPRFAATFELIRHAVELHTLGGGRDYDAENDTRAFRDGVVPRRVSDLTVGRTAQAGACGRRIGEASRGGRPAVLYLSSEPGNGQTHFLHLAAEQASGADLATAWIGDPVSLQTPVAAQTALLSTATIGGLPFIDSAKDAPRDRLEAREAAQRLSGQLTPGAIRALTLIFQALQTGRTEAALPVFRWLCGEDPGSTWRMARGLPRSSGLTSTWPPLLEACCLLTKIAGSKGLLVLVDQRHLASIPLWLHARANGLLVVSGVGAADAGYTLELPSLTSEQAIFAARLIRDRHVAAYSWPSGEAMSDQELLAFVSNLRWQTTRECVRSIVAYLDNALARQDG